MPTAFAVGILLYRKILIVKIVGGDAHIAPYG